MSKMIKIDKDRYDKLVSVSTSFEIAKELWEMEKKNMLNRIIEQSNKVDCFTDNSVKARLEKLKQCYDLAIEMNDPLTAANIAVMI